jgi:hypothetical protein
MKAALSLITLAALLVLAPTPQTMAQEIGQYAIATFPPGGNDAYSHALIIDTKNGHVWEWISQPAMSGRQAFQGLIYQGQVVPGKNSNR